MSGGVGPFIKFSRNNTVAILGQSILMSHALKKAAVVPTDSVKHEARFNGRKNKEHLLGFF